jgi:hypothetical protein
MPTEFILGGIVVILVVVLVIFSLLFINVFIHDPIGTIYNLFIHNPLNDFATEMMNQTKTLTAGLQ